MTHIKIRNIYPILIGGCIWGIVESTAGWIIHLLHFHGASSFLIVIGVFCMTFAALKTNKAISAFQVACIASIFKLSNLLLLSFQPQSWVLSPALYIISEGLIFSLFITFVDSVKKANNKHSFFLEYHTNDTNRDNFSRRKK